MARFHGIIFAYGSDDRLGELVRTRTAASLPFCGRYRLIDFALSSLMNAGVYDVGVIMQRDYQSLLDHLESGIYWDMSRRHGGLKLLPPFGLPEYHRGDYTGTIEALNAVSTYVRDIQADNIILMQGDVAGNIDLSAAMREHIRSNAEITAICTEDTPDYCHNRYIADADGFARHIVFNQTEAGEGYASLEAYIISKKLLTDTMDLCAKENLRHFHRDAIASYLKDGGKLKLYVHKGYAKRIRSTEAYFKSNMDMLVPDRMRQVFPKDRPVRTKSREDVSTYYGENARVKNSLVADGCRIKGEIESSVIFPDVRIGADARLTNCIVMRGCRIGDGVILENVILDKYAEISDNTTLIGSEKLPIGVPKHSKL